MKHSLLGVVAAFGIVAGATAANAATATYTDEMAFMAAQTAPMQLVEDFEDATLIPGLSFMSGSGSVSGGSFNDIVSFGSSQTMFIKNGLTSFGGTFNLSPGGFGQGLSFDITLNNDSVVNVGGFAAYNGFFGFTSTDTFKKVTISALNSACCQETYSLDNLKVGMVPEPGTWAMLISGFGLVGAAARRRRAVVAA